MIQNLSQAQANDRNLANKVNERLNKTTHNPLIKQTIKLRTDSRQSIHLATMIVSRFVP